MVNFHPSLLKIQKKILLLYLVLALVFSSSSGMAQQYFFPGLGITSSALDSQGVPVIPSQSNGFFDQFRNELEMERYLILNLRGYVDPERFFVSVNYDQFFGYSASQLKQLGINSGGEVLGSSDNLTGNQEVRFRPPLNKLPGLPNFWQRNNPNLGSGIEANSGASEQQVQTVPDQTIGQNLFLGKLKVDFIIDPDISPEVEKLMGRVAYYALKLNTFESYELNFERLPINDLFPNEEQAVKTDSDSLVITLDQKSVVDQQINSDIAGDKWQWFSPWNLLLLLVFLALMGLLINLFRKNNAEIQKQKEIRSGSRDEEGLKTIKKETIEERIRAVPIESTGLTEEEEEDFQIFFVRNTVEIGKVFTHWIEDLGNEGLERTHSILLPFGRNFYTLLIPYLSKTATEKLLESFKKDLRPVPVEMRKGYLKMLFDIITARLGIDSMALLDSLEKEELFSMFDLLNEKDAAMALFHMKLDWRAEYLRSVSDFRAVDILLHVHAIPEMGYTEYERLGELISKKLVELRFFKRYRKMERQFMVETLDAIDQGVRDVVLENLQVTDPMLHDEIKKYQLSWSDVPLLDQELVRDATIDFNSDELGIAFRYRPYDIEPIIQLRPERERELIFELAKLKGNDMKEEAEEISKRMLNAIKAKQRGHEKKYKGQ